MTHLALVRDADGGIAVRQRPTPRPGPGELLLEPLVAGICGTDLQILARLRSDPAPVLGHEGIARVLATGPGTDGPAPGAVVIVNPTHPHDDSFLLGHNVDGLWAERTLIPAAAVTGGLVLTLPAYPSGALPALIEPLASVLYSYDITAAIVGAAPRTLVIWGDGIIGHLAARFWRRRHPETTIVQIHHTDRGLRWSDRHGSADIALRHDDPALPRALSRAAGPVAGLLATPRTATVPALVALDAAIRAELFVDVHGGLAPGRIATNAGVLDIARIRAYNCGGEPNPPRAERFARPFAARLTVFGHRGVANSHLAAATAELDADPAGYGPLVTHETDLATAAELLTAILRGERAFRGERVIKAAVTIGAAA
ncbi:MULTISPECIES: alcohol dehydrogenase catalytic domain-containing protein [unclassified Nocardia]|uniref:alcohol dehydrogenase catalytic domain-containing protein n=1 Tax=unclassified Nocardia TaxID=2637762 RepID=UPI001CE3EFF7|nr:MULTISPECIES: alcohol dehydrogenase catalytic domain-containing protein [unclassified Nocardia]